MRSVLRRATHGPIARDAITVAAAVGAFGISFGVLARSADLSLLQTQAMSLLVFTGASQFSAVSVIAAGGGPVTAIGTALLLAARNGVYGMALAPVVRGGPLKRLLGAQLVIDESAAMAAAQQEPAAQRAAFWLTGAWLFLFWNLGTLVGALVGEAVQDPEALGLDVVFPASFLALLAPQLRGRPARATALIACAIALPLVPIVPIGLPILAASSAAILVGLLQMSGIRADVAEGDTRS